MTIDFNCDMGEGIGNENIIMPFLQSANITCGLHAGNANDITDTILLCIKHGVNIGAHPSFDDRENFGRKEIQLSLPELYDLIIRQLQWLDNIVQNAGSSIKHVKPHGALYNMSAKDEEYAKCIAAAISDFNADLILYGLSGSISITAATNAGLQTRNEVFADRTYTNFGQLTPRSQPNACILTVDDLKKQLLQIVNQKSVTSTDGTIINMKADTICMHGDGENAVAFAPIIADIINRN